MSGLQSIEPTILYVDDQPSHRLLFERTFRGNWLVLTASSAEEGLEILKEHDVFLVVADHNMPGETGIDFLEKARKVSPKSVRAILSAYVEHHLKAEAIRRAAVAQCFEKPWDKVRIRAFIEESFLRYLHGAEEGKEERKPSPLPAQSLSDLTLTLDQGVDDRGAKRIFLTFTEPPLRDFIVVIRRPADEKLIQAALAAIGGKLSAMEKSLLEYLNEKPLETAQPPAPMRH